MTRPVRLKNTPIVESISEIRFDSNLPIDLVPGVLFAKLNSLDLTDINKLPILEIPQTMRMTDVNLLYSPYYKAKYGEITVQYGARVILISSPIPYIGWDSLRPAIEKVVEVLIDAGVASRILRVANRTIDFFDNDSDILTNSNFTTESPINLPCKQYNYTNIYQNDNLIIKTTLANQAMRNVKGSAPQKGSIMDIDSFSEVPFDVKLDLIMQHVDDVHTAGKNIFFDLLKKDFMESLGPEYE